MTECNKIFVSYGVRWSSLWRLPYWDPAHQLVVDFMHCLLLGLAQAHFRKYLGLTSTIAKSSVSKVKRRPAFKQNFHPINELPGPLTKDLTAQDLRDVEKLQTLLISGKDDDIPTDTYLESLKCKLMARHVATLKVVAEDLDLKVERGRATKTRWVETLITWVSNQTPMLLGLIFFFSIKECRWIPLWKFVFQHQRFLTEFVQLFRTVICLLGFDRYLQTSVMQGQAPSRWMNGTHWQQCIFHWLSSVCRVRAHTINQLRRKPSFEPSWTILCTWSLPFTLPALPP